RAGQRSGALADAWQLPAGRTVAVDPAVAAPSRRCRGWGAGRRCRHRGGHDADGLPRCLADVLAPGAVPVLRRARPAAGPGRTRRPAAGRTDHVGAVLPAVPGGGDLAACTGVRAPATARV